MFLSDFSIKRPVSTVVVIIGLMCLGLLALKNLRVNQIPAVEQPVMVVRMAPTVPLGTTPAAMWMSSATGDSSPKACISSNDSPMASAITASALPKSYFR